MLLDNFNKPTCDNITMDEQSEHVMFMLHKEYDTWSAFDIEHAL
jgi:hypothetical protein